MARFSPPYRKRPAAPGSLRDIYLYPETEDRIAVNARLDALVERIKRLAEAALSL